MKSFAIPTFILVAAIAAVAAAQQHPMREGRWEITTEMAMPGMPMKMPPQKHVRCITRKDLDNPGGAVPGDPTAKDQCKVTDHKVDGNTITWKMSCPPPQSTSGTGRIVVEGDSYSGQMKMTMEEGEMTMKYSAKRLGDCTEAK